MFEDTDWSKFAICFGLLVIAPVWFFNFITLTFLWKVGFTFAGALGIFIALEYGSMRARR